MAGASLCSCFFSEKAAKIVGLGAVFLVSLAALAESPAGASNDDDAADDARPANQQWLSLPPMKDMGVAVEQSDRGSGHVTRLRDLKTGTVYTLELDLSGRPQAESLESASGTVLFRAEHSLGQSVTDSFEKGVHVREVRRSIGTDLESVERTEHSASGDVHTVTLVRPSIVRGCVAADPTTDDLNKALASADPQAISKILTQSGDRIGPFKVKGCNNFEAGGRKLAETVSDAFSTGLGCLKDLSAGMPAGSPLKRDYNRLLAWTVTGNAAGSPETADLSCDLPSNGNYAEAVTCAEGGPGIKLNPSKLNNPTKDVQETIPNRNARTIFHEAIHWFGHDHYGGPDYCYLIEYCCFKKDQNACGLLKDGKLMGKGGWKSTDYLTRFTQSLSMNGSQDIALATGIAASLADGRGKADYGRLKAVIDAIPSDSSFGSDYRLFFNTLLSSASAGGKTAASPVTATTPVSKAIVMAGQLAGERLLIGDGFSASNFRTMLDIKVCKPYRDELKAAGKSDDDIRASIKQFNSEYKAVVATSLNTMNRTGSGDISITGNNWNMMAAGCE